MNSFVQNALQQPTSLTANGAVTYASSFNSHVDLFFAIGSSRNNPSHAVDLFKKAYKDDAALACRIALWARDIRGGAGEREIFRQIIPLMKLGSIYDIMGKVVEIGRWDGLECLIESESGEVAQCAANYIKKALEDANKAIKLLQELDDISEEECRISLENL